MSEKEGRQAIVCVWEGVALEIFQSVEKSIARSVKLDASPNNLANEAVLEIVKELGGRVIYIPTGFRHDREQRNREIYNLWKDNDVPVRDLAKKYRRSSGAIYEIIANLAKEDGLVKSKNRFIK